MKHRPAAVTNPFSREGDAQGRAIEQQAAEWLARREARPLTGEEERALAEWTAADSRHATAYAGIEAAWRRFDQLGQYPRRRDLPADHDLLCGRGAVAFWGRPSVRAALAAAAVIALGALCWTRPWISTPRTDLMADAALLGPRLVRLSDGSEVELNTGSELVERFGLGERRVQLVRGEAHFTVVKEAARPFLVEANGVAVRAVGTAFNVRIDSRTVQVLVTEGKVRVAQVAGRRAAVEAVPVSREAGEAVKVLAAELVAGQRTNVPTDSGRIDRATSAELVVENVPRSEIERALAWQVSRLDFDATPLAEAVARFNAHRGARLGTPRLRLGDDRVGAILISGRIRADHVASFVDVLETNFGVVVDHRDGGEIILRHAPGR